MAICKLCGQNADLRESHIVPSFVGKWLKDTSATGRLRYGDNPNVPRQDLPKRRLLCKNCEQLFSVAEKQFKENIFTPYHQGKVTNFTYNEWLTRFAVSLTWRAGVVALDEGWIEPQFKNYLRNMLTIQAKFLLGYRPSSKYDHHILFGHSSLPQFAIVPEKFHAYLWRGTDETPISNNREMYMYVQLPGIIFLSSVIQGRLIDWKNTRIATSGTLTVTDQESPAWFWTFLTGRIAEVKEAASHISQQQQRNMADMIKNNPKRAFNSETFRAFLADEFGQE